MNDRELFDAIKSAALLRGDFTLRSGRKSKYYLDKYLFECQPDILRELGERFAKRACPTRRGSPGPSWAAWPWRPRRRWPAACPS